MCLIQQCLCSSYYQFLCLVFSCSQSSSMSKSLALWLSIASSLWIIPFILWICSSLEFFCLKNFELLGVLDVKSPFGFLSLSEFPMDVFYSLCGFFLLLELLLKFTESQTLEVSLLASPSSRGWGIESQSFTLETQIQVLALTAPNCICPKGQPCTCYLVCTLHLL